MCGVRYASDAAVKPRGTIRIIGIILDDNETLWNPMSRAIFSTISSWVGYLFYIDNLKRMQS